MQKWTYLIVTVNNGQIDTIGGHTAAKAGLGEVNLNDEQGFLEDRGAEGWELVTVVEMPESGRYKLFFKKSAEEVQKSQGSGYRFEQRRGI